ncbi:MAG: type IV pilus twitching motility protein PilT [candidate division WOR-3 bacterium]|nr:type IV pilus twitching motility protein PilT [candidate division WOR-3 bacterium]MDH5682899.1 type IV pilus twitching motility protein PilT [candidate division WOR-3 bacterium]
MNVDIDELLKYAAKYGASDLHLTVGNPPIIRVNGRLKRIPGPSLTAEEVRTLIFSILSEEQRAKLEKKRELDLSYSWGTAPPYIKLDYQTSDRVRARVNVFLEIVGIGAAFRIIPARIRSLDELPAPESVKELTRRHKGLVLVTGPTGCGKSTTLASMIDFIDHQSCERIITIEDPIEYIFQGKNCLISQREIGVHSTSFASALRACLREDPDVILVGEMRDLETISLALTAAETGHLILSTLHTNNVAETVDRVIDVFPSEQHNYVRQIFANVIMGIISQILAPRKDGRGRVAVMELLIATPAIRNQIREAKSYQIPSLVQTGSQYGMQTMDQCLANLLRKGLISQQTAWEYATDKKMFKREEVETEY